MQTKIDKLICLVRREKYQTDAEIAAMPIAKRVEISRRAADDAAMLLVLVVFPALLLAFCLLAY